MLWSSKQCNESTHEVDVTTPAQLYKLLDRDLLRRLMQRTGDGSPVSIRTLAVRVGVPHGTVGNLLTGEQEAVAEDTAKRMAQVIGVDVLVLFAPIGRSVSLSLVEESVSA